LPILGQIEARPVVGETWAQAKFILLERALGYKCYANEVKAFHESEAPVRIVSAPARTSKSWTSAHDTLVYGMPTEPLCDSLHWSIGPTYDTNKEFDYWWQRLVEERQKFAVGKSVYRITRAQNNARNGDMEIVIEHGRDASGHMCRAVFEGKSATNEKSLQGEEVTTATLSEAAEHPSHILPKYVSTRAWKTILPTTPKQSGAWIRDLISKGRGDKTLGIESFDFPYYANPLYNKERLRREHDLAVIRAREEIGPHATAEDDPYFAEQFLGKWVYFTGRVLPFNEARHVLRDDPDELETASKFVSVDYGYEDESVALFWAIYETGILHIFDEIYCKHLVTQKFVDGIREKIDVLKNVSYATGDPRQPQVAALMRDAGLPVFTMNKRAQSDRAAGMRRLIDLLTAGPYQQEGSGVIYPGIYVSARCVETINEWNTLRFREGMRNEYSPGSFAGKDHATDAARYGVMTRPAPSGEEKERDWLSEERNKHSRSYERIYYPEGVSAWG
jgi:hypothetical protein